MKSTSSTVWYNGEFLPWDKAQIHLATHGLHYGSGVFEGIRVYETPISPAVFRLTDHMKRFFYSANALKMTLDYSLDALIEATLELLRRTQLTQGYIRPVAFYNADSLGVNPKGAKPSVAIMCFDWGKYFAKSALALKTSDFIRIHPKSTIVDAKINGHYVNSIMASQQVDATPYDDALLLDFEGNVAECSAANIFIIKDNALLTPAPGSILPGITRQTVLEDIAPLCGLTAKETTITLDDIYTADEAFVCGTAIEVAPVRSLDDKIIGQGTSPVGEKIAALYHDMACGKLAKFERHLTFV